MNVAVDQQKQFGVGEVPQFGGWGEVFCFWHLILMAGGGELFATLHSHCAIIG